MDKIYVAFVKTDDGRVRGFSGIRSFTTDKDAVKWCNDVFKEIINRFDKADLPYSIWTSDEKEGTHDISYDVNVDEYLENILISNVELDITKENEDLTEEIRNVAYNATEGL